MNNLIGRNNGILNEKNIVSILNNKRKCDLNDHFKNLISIMFENSVDDDVIKCSLCTRTAKPDIYVSIKGKMKFVSIKSGKNDSVHLEGIKPFILFLRSLGVSEKTQKTILLFQYGDGTMTGKGQNRYELDQLKIMLKDRIKEANEELNNKGIIAALFNRACVFGNEYRSMKVDYFYYGTNKSGILVDQKILSDFILSKKHFDFHTLHIGPMTIQPYLRDVNRVSKNQFKRDYVQLNGII